MAAVSAVPAQFPRLFFLVLFTLMCWTSSPAQDSSPVQVESEAAIASRPLITQPLEEAQFTVLKGNTHPLARREFDLGTAPASLPMERMLLVLKRSPEQETALRRLLDDH